MAKEDGELVPACKLIKQAIEIYGFENIEAWHITPAQDITSDLCILPILTDEFLGKG